MCCWTVQLKESPPLFVGPSQEASDISDEEQALAPGVTSEKRNQR